VLAAAGTVWGWVSWLSIDETCWCQNAEQHGVLGANTAGGCLLLLLSAFLCIVDLCLCEDGLICCESSSRLMLHAPSLQLHLA
jgi:hypothetical protein